MNPEEIVQMLFVLLSQFNIKYTQQSFGNSTVYEVPKFGVKIIYLDGQTFDKKILDGWQIAYIHPDYTISDSKEKIVWALARGGYFHYLRNNYKKTFHQMMYSQGWDRLLVDYRMKLYKDTPKYAYLREINSNALKTSSSYMISMDPGFYDWVVE